MCCELKTPLRLCRYCLCDFFIQTKENVNVPAGTQSGDQRQPARDTMEENDRTAAGTLYKCAYRPQRTKPPPPPVPKAKTPTPRAPSRNRR